MAVCLRDGWLGLELAGRGAAVCLRAGTNGAVQGLPALFTCRQNNKLVRIDLYYKYRIQNTGGHPGVHHQGSFEMLTEHH